MSQDSLSLVLATSNGVGMGHLSRQLAIGMAAQKAHRATLFSLSIGLATVAAHGVPGEYCPGPDRGWMPEVAWSPYLRDRMAALVKEVDGNVVVFDGVAPYRGVTLARRLLPDTHFVWFRRGMWQPNTNEGQLWKADLFDTVIEPGDLAANDDAGPTAEADAVRVPPVSLHEVIPSLPRSDAAEALGVDADRQTLLLTLGTGRLGEVASPGSRVLAALADYPDWQVLVTRPGIATDGVPLDGADVKELRGVYPLVRYGSLFDVVVSAAGYNAVHEFVAAATPTLLVPNEQTRTDDQVARARSVANRGLALSTIPGAGDLETQIQKLLEPGVMEEMTSRIESLPTDERTGGAAATVAHLVDLATGSQGRPMAGMSRFQALRADAREGVKRLLGPAMTRRVREMLGRQPVIEGDRLAVQVVEGEGASNSSNRPLYLTSNPSTDLLLQDDPVEDVLEGSSAIYADRRRFIIDKYYDVVD